MISSVFVAIFSEGGAPPVPEFLLPPAARTLHILADGRAGAGISEFRHDAAGPWIAKDPDSVLDYGVDWGVPFNSWLGDDVIDAVAWAVPTGLTKGAESNSDTVAKVRLSGGTVGVIYTVTCRITTDRGQTDDRSFRIVAQER